MKCNNTRTPMKQNEQTPWANSKKRRKIVKLKAIIRRVGSISFPAENNISALGWIFEIPIEKGMPPVWFEYDNACQRIVAISGWSIAELQDAIVHPEEYLNVDPNELG